MELPLSSLSSSISFLYDPRLPLRSPSASPPRRQDILNLINSAIDLVATMDDEDDYEESSPQPPEARQ
jgi:hypothetical protein